MIGSLAQIISMHRRRLEQVPRIAAAEASARTTARTPVDTGRARSSWGASVPVQSLQLGGTYEFVSSLSYIRPLEAGWSRQAPGGMVKITAAEWPEIVATAVARARG